MLIRIGPFYFTFEGLLFLLTAFIGVLMMAGLFGVVGLGLFLKHFQNETQMLSRFFQ